MKIEVDLISMKNGNPTEIRFNNTIYQLSTIESILRKPEHMRRKYEMIKPKDAVHCDVYQTWVFDEEIDIVREAVETLNGPGTKQIMKRTGLGKHRVLAALHVLKRKGEVAGKKVKNRKVIYRIT